MEHLPELVHGRPAGGLVKQAGLRRSESWVQSPLRLQALLQATLDHHGPVLPLPAVHLQEAWRWTATSTATNTSFSVHYYMWTH